MIITKILSLLMVAIIGFLHLSESMYALEVEGRQKISPSVVISEVVVAENVEERVPIGIADTFPVDIEKVYVFIEAKDIATDTELTVEWYHEGKKVHSYTLPLQKGPRWRTYSYKNIYRQTGDWEVKVINKAGNEIKSITFQVK
ncbi:MAG: DUF2914 domain-containing protein [Nitrospirota bacterium]